MSRKLNTIISKFKNVISGNTPLLRIFNLWKLNSIRKLSKTYGNVAGTYGKTDIPIKKQLSHDLTAVDEYWSDHVINEVPFSTRWESMEYYKWLLNEYPLYSNLMELDKKRTNQIVLDYGCGPGNDLFRLLILNQAQKVVGVDVSLKSLELAKKRLCLYEFDTTKLELINISDSSTSLPLENNMFDHINCAGVLHHLTNLEPVLGEFKRILKPGATGHIMIYNRDSIFFHLVIAYIIRIINNRYNDVSMEEAFSKNTDGENCPISKCYQPGEFIEICKNAGFEVDYAGGYFYIMELHWLKKYRFKAIKDFSLPEEHKNFLMKLEYSGKYPVYEGKYAGIGGVYKIVKPL